MSAPAFDENAFDVQAFDPNAYALQEGIGPTPTTGGTFERRRLASMVKRGGVGSLRGGAR